MLIYSSSRTAIKKLAAGKTIYGKILVHSVTVWQTTAHRPNVACSLFLYGLPAKNCFLYFKRIEERQRQK